MNYSWLQVHSQTRRQSVSSVQKYQLVPLEHPKLNHCYQDGVHSVILPAAVPAAVGVTKSHLHTKMLKYVLAGLSEINCKEFGQSLIRKWWESQAEKLLSKIASKAVEMEKELRKRNRVLPLGGQWHSSFFPSIVSRKELLILLGLKHTHEKNMRTSYWVNNDVEALLYFNAEGCGGGRKEVLLQDHSLLIREHWRRGGMSRGGCVGWVYCLKSLTLATLDLLNWLSLMHGWMRGEQKSETVEEFVTKLYYCWICFSRGVVVS